MGAKIETIIKIYIIYFYYCPKKILPVGKSLMTLMTNDLNDHFFLRGRLSVPNQVYLKSRASGIWKKSETL